MAELEHNTFACHTIAVSHFIEAMSKINCKMCGSLFCWLCQETESVQSKFVMLVSVPFTEAGWFLGLSQMVALWINVMVSKEWTSASYWLITCWRKLLFIVHKVEVNYIWYYILTFPLSYVPPSVADILVHKIML
jgi:hypothetical protein